MKQQSSTGTIGSVALAVVIFLAPSILSDCSSGNNQSASNVTIEDILTAVNACTNYDPHFVRSSVQDRLIRPDSVLSGGIRLTEGDGLPKLVLAASREDGFALMHYETSDSDGYTLTRLGQRLSSVLPADAYSATGTAPMTMHGIGLGDNVQKVVSVFGAAKPGGGCGAKLYAYAWPGGLEYESIIFTVDKKGVIEAIDTGSGSGGAVAPWDQYVQAVPTSRPSKSAASTPDPDWHRLAVGRAAALIGAVPGQPVATCDSIAAYKRDQEGQGCPENRSFGEAIRIVEIENDVEAARKTGPTIKIAGDHWTGYVPAAQTVPKVPANTELTVYSVNGVAAGIWRTKGWDGEPYFAQLADGTHVKVTDQFGYLLHVIIGDTALRGRSGWIDGHGARASDGSDALAWRKDKAQVGKCQACLSNGIVYKLTANRSGKAVIFSRCYFSRGCPYYIRVVTWSPNRYDRKWR